MEPTWKPAVELNLDTAGNHAFQETLHKFYEWATAQPPVSPLALQNGWYDVTSQMAEDFLRRNRANRKVGLSVVKKYFFSMRAGDWQRTGQPLIFNREGKAEDLQHRCWACYLGKVSFPSYIVTDAPVASDLFAYIDDNKPRSPADALYTSGINGLSGYLAGAIKLAWRYDNQALGIISQPKVREMSVREVLEYSRVNTGMIDAAHVVMGNFSKAVSVIGNKPVAIFFAWRVIETYGQDVLDEFLSPLGSGANLEEDSAILGLRNRLLQSGEGEEDLKQPRRLALLIKSFNYHITGHKLGRAGLFVKDNEKFPRFVEQQPQLPQAAE